MVELGFFAVHEGRVAEWEQAYAPLDVRMELVKMKLWLEANPKRRKRQYHRFVVNWLNRAYAVLQFQRFKDRDAIAGRNLETAPMTPERAELYKLIDDYHSGVTHADEQGRKYKISPSSRERIYV